jgi:hypothetical protein
VRCDSLLTVVIWLAFGWRVVIFGMGLVKGIGFPEKAVKNKLSNPCPNPNLEYWLQLTLPRRSQAASSDQILEEIIAQQYDKDIGS